MKLNGVLPDEARGLGDRRLGGRRGKRALDGIGVQLERDEVNGGYRLLQRHIHIDHPVLKRLERRQGLPELPALLGIFDRIFQHAAHAAHGFGTDGGDRLVHHLFDQGQALPFDAKQRIAGDPDAVEFKVRCAAAIDQPIIMRRDAGGAGLHEEKGNARPVALLAGRARGDDKVRRIGCAIYHGFCAIDHPAARVRARHGGDVVQIIARCRFAGSKGEFHFAGDHRRKQGAHALPFDPLEQPCADHGRFQIRLHDQRLTERFHDDHRLDGTASHSAQFLRHSGSQDAERRDVLPDGG